MISEGIIFARLVELLDAAKSASGERTEPLDLLIGVDLTADRELVECVRDCFVAERAGAEVTVRALSDVREHDGISYTVALFVVGSQRDRALQLAVARASQGIPCALIADSSLDIGSLEGIDPSVAAIIKPIVASNMDILSRRLARWLVAITDKSIALAASFPFCRQVVVDTLRVRCASQNAALGAVDVINGPDFPIMAINQIKLAFDLAAAHGEPVSLGLLADSALVLVSGVGFRGLARHFNAGMPVTNWVSRGAFAFVGTLASGVLVEARRDGTLKELAISARDFVAAGMGSGSERSAHEVRPVIAALQSPSETGDYVNVRAAVSDGQEGKGSGYITYGSPA